MRKHLQVLKVLAMVNIGLSTLSLAFCLRLLIFHFTIIYKGITTYEYIISQEEKRTNLKKKSKVIIKVENQE